MRRTSAIPEWTWSLLESAESRGQRSRSELILVSKGSWWNLVKRVGDSRETGLVYCRGSLLSSVHGFWSLKTTALNRLLERQLNLWKVLNFRVKTTDRGFKGDHMYLVILTCKSVSSHMLWVCTVWRSHGSKFNRSPFPVPVVLSQLCHVGHWVLVSISSLSHLNFLNQTQLKCDITCGQSEPPNRSHVFTCSW